MTSEARPETTPRWDAQRGRVEVWYATFSEPDGTGWWLHYELVSPSEEGREPFVHGWAAQFPPGAAPVLERFGPVPAERPGAGSPVLLGARDCVVEPGRMLGKTSRLSWDVRISTSAPALYTFPRWAWQREVLPGAQVVDMPAASIEGTIGVDGASRPLVALGAQAHIFGHGNASRWSWLHADLGDGDVCEVVAAVPHLPGGLRVPPLPVVRLRLEGRDMPRDPLVASLLGRATVTLPNWRAVVRLGRSRRIRLRADLDPASCVQVEYPNPDGTSVYCTNTERANAHIVVERRSGRFWAVEREWVLDGNAHAEVGQSEPWAEVEVVPFHGPVGEARGE